MVSVCFTGFAGVPENVGAARRFASAALRMAPEVVVPEETIGNTELIVSELATNALVHTHSGDAGRTFHLRLQVGRRGVWAEVRTRPPRTRFGLPRVVRASEWAEHGRGLYLVSQLATYWGHLAPYEDGVYALLQWKPEQGELPLEPEPLSAM